MLASPAVFNQTRTPFGTKNLAAGQESKATKCIDTLLGCASAPFLLRGMRVEGNHNCVRTAERISRLLFVCTEDVACQYITDDYVASLMRKFDRQFPDSLRQIVFHLIRHMVKDARRFGSARNTWAYPMESFYGSLSRHALSRRHPGTNVYATQTLRIITGSLLSGDFEESAVAMGFDRRFFRAAFLCGNAEPPSLRGKGRKLSRRKLRRLSRRFQIYGGAANFPINKAWAFKSCTSRGRTFLPNKDDGSKDDVKSFVVLPHSADGKIVHLSPSNSRRPRYLEIAVGRIKGLFEIAFLDGSRAAYAEVTIRTGRRPTADILKPYTLLPDPNTVFVPLARGMLHLQPNVHVSPDTGLIQVYSIN